MCSFRQGSRVKQGVASEQRRYLKCNVCPLWRPSQDKMTHRKTIHARTVVLECPFRGTSFSFFSFFSRHYSSDRERKHEKCDLDHKVHVVTAKVNEIEETPGKDPSSNECRSPKAVIYSKFLGDNLTFHINDHLAARKEQNGKQNSTQSTSNCLVEISVALTSFVKSI